MLLSLNNGMFFLMGRAKNKPKEENEQETSQNQNNYFLTNFSNIPVSYYNEENINLKLSTKEL